MTFAIRHGQLADLPYLYEICHLTGYQGRSAEGQISDRFLLGQLFAAPYLIMAPSWTWVIPDSASRPIGYLVTTPDSRAFAEFMDTQWLPALRDLYPEAENTACGAFESIFRSMIYTPTTLPEFIDVYPAHLHIDILPIGQGQGLGRRLMEVFIRQLRDSGIHGFYLGMAEGNHATARFYAKLGLKEISRIPGVVYWGMEL